MTAQAPIAWNPLADPYALLGDVGWANYKVSSDVLLQQPGYVQVIGRATGQRPFVPSALDRAITCGYGTRVRGRC